MADHDQAPSGIATEPKKEEHQTSSGVKEPQVQQQGLGVPENQPSNDLTGEVVEETKPGEISSKPGGTEVVDTKTGKHDDDDDDAASVTSEDVDLLLIAQDSDDSDDDDDDDETEDKTPRSIDTDDTSQASGAFRKGGSPRVKEHSDDGSSKDDELRTEGESDVEYKVKITRFGGGDFEGFEITHEPVSKIHGGKEEQKEDEKVQNQPTAGMKTASHDDDVSESSSVEEVESGEKPAPGRDNQLPSSSNLADKEQILSRSREGSVKDDDKDTIASQPMSPGSSSDHKSSSRLLSSPISSDFKPWTPGTLSSQSSTTGSYDESTKSVGDSGSSKVLHAMRNSTRVRRESRVQREREWKLLQSKQGQEKSRTKVSYMYRVKINLESSKAKWIYLLL